MAICNNKKCKIPLSKNYYYYHAGITCAITKSECVLKVKRQLQRMSPLQPMNIFLRQEVERMQRVIGSVRSTLSDLELAIDGQSVSIHSGNQNNDLLYYYNISLMNKIDTVDKWIEKERGIC